MKRRILALMLCLVTLLTMLVSCQKEEISDEDLNKEQSVRTAVSINMWVVTENKISIIINGSLPVREVDVALLEKTKSELGIKKGDFVIGICARLEEYRGASAAK